MRDDNDYAAMDVGDLRVHLTRVSKELATWSYALSCARREETLYFIDGYRNSMGKSIAERKMDGEVNASEYTREIRENEGYVAFWTAIRDLIVQLLKHEAT